MKRKVMALLTAALLLAGTVLPVNGVWAEEELELTVSGGEQVQTKGDDLSDLLDQIINNNASIMGSLGQTDWTALAESVAKTGKWRDDLVAVAQTQEGYRAEVNGDTIYTQWAEQPAGTAWDAMFVSWAAEKAGLTEKQFPHGNSFEELKAAMKKVGAVKEISRANYPNTGDVALLKVKDAEIAGVVAYVSNGYAAVIHARNGEVVRETYLISGAEFQQYVDMNVLMERAGLESGKGGEAPVIPEGGVAAWTNTNAVYMRKEPTTASKSLTTVKKSGTALLVVSAEKQEDGYIWYGVEYKSYKGYIRGDLLKLDMAAVTVPSQAQEAPEAPEQTEGCASCKAEAGNVVLPVECCHEHLAKLGSEYAGLFMNALREVDKATWELYVKCHDAHVKAGAEQIVPLGGMGVQERVVNVEVIEGGEGQSISITFDIYGATAYEWHQVRTDDNGAADSILPEATTDTLTITAQTDAAYSYYCVATIIGVRVTSKMTALNVNATDPITAEAILGEEINFTYEHEDAVSYQWYVNGETIPADSTEYTGAASSTLTFCATAENAGKLYSCVATAANGSTCNSATYAYTVTVYEQVDASVCEGHDLCKYVEELANMTRVERYAAMTQTWNIAYAGGNLADYVQQHWAACHKDVYTTLLCTCGANALPGTSHKDSCAWYVKSSSKVERPDDCETCVEESEYWGVELPEIGCCYEHLKTMTPAEAFAFLTALDYDNYAAYRMYADCHNDHVEENDDALVICPGTSVCAGIHVAPGEEHTADNCPWNLTAEEIEIADRIEAEPEFAEWMETATEEMIARALKVKSLEHVVFELNADGTGDVYIAREENPRATIDSDGYITDIHTGLVIARRYNGYIYPIAEDPAPVAQ